LAIQITIQVEFYISCALRAFSNRFGRPYIVIFGGDGISMKALVLLCFSVHCPSSHVNLNSSFRKGYIGSHVVQGLVDAGLANNLYLCSRGNFSFKSWIDAGVKIGK
jgi:hypothetical protein